MAKKKIKLTDLKVKSFVTTLSTKEQKTAKGGLRIYAIDIISEVKYWTAVKTQFRDAVKTKGNTMHTNRGGNG